MDTTLKRNFGGPLWGLIYIVLGICLLAGCTTGPASGAARPNDWILEWHDEFDKPGQPDPQIWVHEKLGPGTYNNELQAYTDKLENSRVEDGKLIIEAHPIPGTTRGYTSARLLTRGRKHLEPGSRLEVRAKLPLVLGSWPAIWLLPTSSQGRQGWPHSGEIDVMEYVGFDPERVHSSVHSSKYNWPNGNNFTESLLLPNGSAEFHTYALEWTDQELRFFVDEQLVGVYENEGSGWEAWPFDRPFYLILNFAVGGSWGGQEGVNREGFPARFEIDWVRAYRMR